MIPAYTVPVLHTRGTATNCVSGDTPKRLRWPFVLRLCHFIHLFIYLFFLLFIFFFLLFLNGGDECWRHFYVGIMGNRDWDRVSGLLKEAVHSFPVIHDELQEFKDKYSRNLAVVH